MASWADESLLIDGEATAEEAAELQDEPSPSLLRPGRFSDYGDSAEERHDEKDDDYESGSQDDFDPDDEEEPFHNSQDKKSRQSLYEISKCHNNLVSAALQGRDTASILANADEFFLSQDGEMNSSILHVMSDSWTTRFTPLFKGLMGMYPDMYLRQDYLGRSILNRNEVGRTRDRFVRFFLSSYPAETANIISRQPSLLGFMLTTLPSSRAWLVLLERLPPAALEAQEKDGNTFLHLAIQQAHEKAPAKATWLPQVIRQAIVVKWQLLLKRNKQGKTPYQYHVKLLRQAKPRQTESPAKRTEREKDTAPRIRITEPEPPIKIAESEPTKDLRKPPDPRSRKPEEEPDKSTTPFDLHENISIVLLREMYCRLDVNELRNILHGAGEELEIDLDLAELAITGKADESLRVVRSILDKLKLHSYLRNVWIPRCNPDEGVVSHIFELLHCSGVKRIMHLDVDEDINRPHSDKVIIEALAGHYIEELSWKKTDMCSSILTSAPTIQSVQLYSSGNHAVLRSWSAEDGLLSLPRLTKVHLFILPRIESRESVEEYAIDFQDRISSNERRRDTALKKMAEKRSEDSPIRNNEFKPRRKLAIEFNVIVREERKQNEPLTWTEALGETTRALNMPRAVQDQRPWMSTARLMDLLHVLFHPRYDLPVGVKVAIIDDGIDLSRVQGCVLTGKSYAGYSSGRPKPFYFSSTGQGTEVASLVSHFYPRLQLCVVRIDPDDASLRTLAQAIQWAINQDVDIIAVSRTPAQPSSWDVKSEEGAPTALSAALDAAQSANVLVLWAAGDITGFPISHKAAVPIAATRWSEDVQLPAAEHVSFTVSVKGLDLPATLSQDAAATALAAGIATLLIASGKAHSWVESMPPAVVSTFKTLCSAPYFKHISVGPLIKALEVLEGAGQGGPPPLRVIGNQILVRPVPSQL